VLYRNGNVQVWEMRAGGEAKTFVSVGGWYEEDYSIGGGELALSADGRYVFAPSDPGGEASGVHHSMIRLDPAGSVYYGPFYGPLLAPVPDRANRGVVEDIRAHHLAVWDFDKGEIIARLPRHSSRVGPWYSPLRAAISADGRLLASGSYNGLVRVWDIDARRMIGEGRVGGPVTAMVFDSGGQQLAVGRQDGQIVVFQVSDPK
jgi:hypothetical protein